MNREPISATPEMNPSNNSPARMIPRPNFFIVGAPKCGTSSLAHWLGSHRQIFFAPGKEPHFFNTDEHRSYTVLKDYEALFQAAGPEHRALGEASTWYLYSKTAIANIEAYNPKARYIVCLRNPIEMAPSLHEQKVFLGYENEPRFAKAWALNAERARGRAKSIWCKNPRHLDYGSACKIGEQLAALLRIVPRERVMTLLLEDMKQDPGKAYRDTLAFLGLEDDGKTDFDVINPAKERKSRLVHYSMQSLIRLKELLGLRKSLGILTGFDRWNVKFRDRAPIDPELRRTLQAHFREDIQTLSALLDRDLSHWLTP